MQRIAVFARNHEDYLNAACKATELTQPVTFQSERRWVTARKALDTQPNLKIYFAPIGAGEMVRYEATLKDIVLDPEEGDPLLDFRPDSTEGLWGKTIYAVSDCRPCEKRNLSSLEKLDGSALSENFGYSYALVRELAPAVEPHPGEIPAVQIYYEGALAKVYVNAYERDAAARQACINHYGTSCLVCGFNFGATYGDIGKKFIHVHHLKPLASIKENYCVNPIQDLMPVCPNCHAMLHNCTPPLSIEELKNIISITASPF